VKRRVVITGLGLLSPVGNDVASTWRALVDGANGVGPITQFDTTNFPVKFACELKGFDPLQYMDRKEVKRNDVFTQMALAASVQAMNDAGLNDGGYDPENTGVIIGSGIGGLKVFEAQHDVYRERGPGKISAFFIPMFIPDMAAGIVSIRFNAKGPNYATVSACATSAHAIGDAYRTIQYGDADVMITGGSEAAITPMAIGGFANMQALSENNEDFQHASRPFDKERDGFVMGEGAGMVILEELEHAKRRGARIYGEVVGYGMTGDAYHITQPAPEGEGAQRSMRRALKDAGIGPATCSTSTRTARRRPTTTRTRHAPSGPSLASTPTSST
jgi:3-oxoacyl-[acyl-carrier-protein] synthase II